MTASPPPRDGKPFRELPVTSRVFIVVVLGFLGLLFTGALVISLRFLWAAFVVAWAASAP